MFSVDDLHEVAKSFLAKLKLSGVVFSLTGSRVFGLSNRSSDLDVIISIKDTVEVERIIRDVFKREIIPSDYNNGWKFGLCGLGYPINLIRLHPEEWIHWKNATKWLTYMLDTSPQYQTILKNKSKRYGVFEHLVSLSRMIGSMESPELSLDEVDILNDRRSK